MLIKFYGHSDDLVELDVNGKCDEWGCYQSDDDQVHLSAMIATIGKTKGVVVHAIYDGTWSFAVAKCADGLRLPGWKFDVGDKHDYSVGLTVDTGDDLVEVIRVKRGGHEWVPWTEDD